MSRCRVYIETGLVPHHCHYTPIEAIAMEIPVIFWSGSGMANEAMIKFSTAELLNMGMYNSWDEMSAMAEKCLIDVDFAIALSKKQRPLENIVTEDEIIADMIKFKERIPSILKKYQNIFILRILLFLGKTKDIHISLSAIKIICYFLFKKRKSRRKLLLKMSNSFDIGQKISRLRLSIKILLMEKRQQKEFLKELLKN